MKVICYGDSNTCGYDPRTWFGDCYDSPWPRQLAVNTGWQVLNRGENGREVPIRPVSFPEDTDLLILMLGTNDLLQGRDVETTLTRMEAFLASLSLEKEKILLIGPPPMALGTWVPTQMLIQKRNALAEAYRALGERSGIRFLDPKPWNTPLVYDGVHLTQEGHDIFAHEIFEFILKEYVYAGNRNEST